MKWRYSFIQFTFAVLFFGICLRLGQIMLLNHSHYQTLASQQHLVEQTISAKRGEIYTSEGYPLVVNSDTYLLFAVPKDMEDKEATAATLAEALAHQIITIPLDESHIEKLKEKQEKEEQEATPTPTLVGSDTDEKMMIGLPATPHLLRQEYPDYVENTFKEVITNTLLEKFKDDQNQFVQLILQLDPEQKRTLYDLRLPGLYFQQNTKRSYPEGDMASQTLGIVGKDANGNDQGYFGLEGYYDGDLSGRSGYRIQEKDVEGKPIPFGISTSKDPSHGRDFVLTIQRDLQYVLEKHLEEGVKKTKSLNGTAVLLDPYSGAVWAMANYPTYNPEYWTEVLAGESDVSKVELFRNMAVSDNYEPGSVMKPLTMSMALNEGLVTPTTTFEDAGPVTYSGYEVRTWNNKYYGEINMIQVLQLSHNTGAAWIGHQVGFDKFGYYVDKYRFGRSTGIDIQGEEFGIVRERSEWRDIDLANMSFGQGISVTPLQMTVAFSALVNGGKLYQPRLVDKIYDYRGIQPVEIDLEPKLTDTIISEKTSETVRLMLQQVVTGGEFKWFVQQAGMDAYAIGGKTGTAQIPVNGHYDPSKTNTTFVGFAPVDTPKFVMLMKLSQPSTSTYSADTVVPMWMETAAELVNYFKIPPQ